MRRILKCRSCGFYTLRSTCACGLTAETPKPAKYSPADKYAHYRRAAKKERSEKEDLL